MKRYRYPAIDEMLPMSPSLSEMAEASKMKYGKPGTKEGIREYLKRTGQYHAWIEERKSVRKSRTENAKRLRKARENLVRALSAVMHCRAAEEGREYVSALEYDDRAHRRRRPSQDIPFSSLVRLFRETRMAREKGIKMSLRKLGKMTGINYYSTRDILLSEGERPMCWTWSRIPDEKKKAIERAYQLPLSVPDATYFVGGVSENTVQYQFELIRKGKGGARPRRPISLAYRDADQIYTGADMGLTAGEIAHLLGKHPGIISYAIGNRKQGLCLENEIERMRRIIRGDDGGLSYSKPA